MKPKLKKTVLAIKSVKVKTSKGKEFSIEFTLYKKAGYISGVCNWKLDGEENSDQRTFGRVGNANVKELIADWVNEILQQVGTETDVENGWDASGEIKSLEKVLPAELKPTKQIAKELVKIAREICQM